MKSKNYELSPLCILLSIALLLNGGFFDDSVALIGMSIAICLLVMLVRGENFYARDKRLVFWMPLAICALSLVVSVWAVDYMDNLLGVMRLFVLLLWMWLVRCRDKGETEQAKQFLPLLGCVNVGCSLLSLCVPSIAPYFWENSRMSGFFQYANTNALFLTIGIIILVHGWKEEKIQKVQNVQNVQWKSLVEIFILLAGLLLSGSRTVLLLTFLWGCVYAIRTKYFRKPFLIGSGLFVLLGGAFVAITGNTQNIGRIFTIFTSNSTLWGRLLYYRDAILALCTDFFGMGRLGFYYKQGTFQTGVYHIRFVHNDFLQIALDYGVLALLALLFFLGWQVIRGKQKKIDKELLLFICVASLVDFHCQYFLILMVCSLLLDYGEGEKEKKKQLRENYILLPLLVGVFLYIGVATACGRYGQYDKALFLLPDYTFAQEKKILSCMGTVESYEMAERLTKKNPYNITGYIAEGLFGASQCSITVCLPAMDKVVELDPYNVEYYRQYENILQNMLLQAEEYSANTGRALLTEEEQTILQERALSLPEQLEKMEERTSSLAYKIKDKPVFSYE